ncbi:MAG: PQQ-binding-like beta-propeller repeat protein [Candidatus Latescibacterota bacterium]|nr:MAG: PQQ-binding-like beta-propeller repeat protein [Candidatus Latescibacterota bacterium]
MRRELTFHPETERTRDLIYSEQSSCDRSLHLLIQDNSGIPYEFLLKAYRTVVTRHLSSLNLRPPEAFLKGIVVQLENDAIESGLDVEDFRGAGFYLLLKSPDAVYVLTLNDRESFLLDGGQLVCLSDVQGVGGGGVERLRITEDDLQKELFAQRLCDMFMLFQIDSGFIQDRDIVLGCGEQSKGTVLEALNDPSWSSAADGTKKAIKSKFVTGRILCVRFGPPAVDTEPVFESMGRPFGGEGTGTGGRRNLVAVVAVVAVVGLVGAIWLSDRLFSGGGNAMDRGAAVITEEPVHAGEPAPDPTGTTSDELLMTAELEAISLTAVWSKTYSDQVTSSPVLHGNSVVFGCRDGHVYALDKGTGAARWKFAASAGVGASPAVHGDNIIAADYNGHIYAIHLTTGKEVWNRKLPMKVVSSPQVVGDRVLIGCYDSHAYCLSAVDGTVVWKQKTGGRVRASTVAAGETFVVPSYDGYLYGLDLATGAVRWRANIGGQLAGAAAAVGNTVVIGAPDGRVCAVGSADGTAAWSYKTGGGVKSSPVIQAGKVYVGSNDTWLYCFGLADGSLIWKHKTGDLVLARPHVDNGVVYVGSYDGHVHALDASDGTLLDKYDTGGAIYSSPTGDGEHLFFGNNSGDFICLSYHDKSSS